MSLQGPLPAVQKLCPSSFPVCGGASSSDSKKPACKQETLQVRSVGGEDPLQKGEMGKTVWLDIQDTRQTVRFKGMFGLRGEILLPRERMLSQSNEPWRQSEDWVFSLSTNLPRREGSRES